MDMKRSARPPGPAGLPSGPGPGARPYRRARWWLALLAAGCFALALLRPGLNWPARVGSTLLVVDITQSMNVADMRAARSDAAGLPGAGAPLTRLAYTRALLRSVLRELPCGHSLGLGVFTERKTMVLLAPIEVCAHQAALDDALSHLDWRMAWAADSHIFYGSYSALEQLRAHWPGVTLAFFTDGHQAPPIFPGSEPRFDKTGATPAGALFGVGGLTAQPVPRTNADGQVTGYWTAEEAAAFSAQGAPPTLSVGELERMAAGGDVRNRAQRPPGAEGEYLSARNDRVLARVAEITGLQVHEASDAASVSAAIRALPGGALRPQRHELHGALVLAGALALLAGLLPQRWWRRRRPRVFARAAGTGARATSPSQDAGAAPESP